MLRPSRRRLTPFLAVLLSMTALFTKGFADRPAAPDLGGPDRFLTALTTDKPVYKIGELVYARGVLLHAKRHTPLPEQAMATIEIKGPKGDTVVSSQANTQDGVWGFSWQIPEGQAGGEYTLRVAYPWNGHAPAERKFDVRVYRAPRLKSQIVFLRDGYGPGDKVSATLDVKRAEGGVPAGAKVTATARVDGAEVARVPATVDGAGLCTVSFELPRQIARGDGSLAFAIEDGGVVETAAKTIPILLQTIDLKLFPEGGDLVAGLPNRVYFEARTPVGKPADISGVIVNEKGEEAGTFRSAHEGRGRFELTPARGAKYSLKITEPAGIKTAFPLPDAKADGAILHATEELTAAGARVKLVAGCSAARKLKITLSRHELEIASATVEVGAGKTAEVALDARDLDGVLIATAWDEKGAPLAERLVFRAPANPLTIELRADKKSYVPGDTVKLTARTTAGGKPVSAVVGLTVTDDAVLEMIEKREQAPRLPVMFFLEPEVRELADAHVYLDPKSPKAPLAVDLLLGTQGWRRFGTRDAVTFVGAFGDQARRALAMRIVSQVEQRRHFEDLEEGAPGGVGLGGLGQAGGMNHANRGGGPPRPMAMPPQALPPMAARPPAPPPAMPVAVAAPQQRAAGRLVAMDEKQVMPPRDQPMEDAIAKSEVASRKKDIWGGDKEMKRRNDRGPQVVVVYVREFAHQLRAGHTAADRVDFTETLYWNAGVRTDAKSGEATVQFALNDSVTTFRAFADGYSNEGAIGAAVSAVESVQPFYVEPKLPLEVTAGDVIRLPVSLVNGTSSAITGATVKASAPGDLTIATVGKFDLKALERVRRILEVKVGHVKEPVDFTIAASAGQFTDNVTRRLSIKPNGFPFETAFGGMTVANGVVTHTLEIPKNVVPASLRTTVGVYPTPLANLTEALSRLIQDPSGCFEQTSSTTYPMTMAQQYFLSHQGVDPKIVQLAKEKLEAGYKRLVGFECSDKGYEWFGENPGHEALTAYGVMHFTDMAQVREIDRGMLTRSQAWLMKQRDGKGGFERKRRALHTWIEDKDCSNGYILWALLETGEKGLGKEIAAFKEASAQSANSYVSGLGANALAIAGEGPAARALMVKLAAKQEKDGHVGGATNSIVGSGGDALNIETTSLAVLAWLRNAEFAGNVERSIKYLADSCQGGRYGSTQSTVLALRAIVAYDKARAKPKAPGSVRVFVDGQAVGSAVAFDQKTQGAIKLPDFSELLGPGTHKIELKMTGGGEMPYAIGVNYNALTPASAKETKVALQVKLGKGQLTEGELIEATASVTNLTQELIPTTVAIVGLPGGLEPRHDQLKELVKKGTIDAYEVLGREVVLYWRGMEPGKTVAVPLSLVAGVPGSYTGPASRAYLYYTDEHKQWVDGLKVEIAPKG